MTSTLRSLGKAFLGVILAALPFTVFSEFGKIGVLISILISVPIFLACCVANRVQLQSMLGIMACTTIGLIIGAIFSPVHQSRSVSIPLYFFASIGCVAGLIWSEFSYDRQSRRRALTEKSARESSGEPMQIKIDANKSTANDV